MIYVAVLEIALPRWWSEAPDLIKILSELIVAAGVIITFLKTKAYVLFLKLIKLAYNKLPFMKRIAWLETQMVHKNAVLDSLLDGQNI